MQMVDVLKRLQEIAETKPELVKDAVDNVQRTNPADVKEGGMSDIHIGAQEAIADYLDGPDGDLTMPKRDVIADLMAKSKKASFPTSYEYSTAADMVMDKFDENGQRITGKEESINTSTMENKQKETVKEAIQIKTDTPEEAGVMMQILKLAGVQPVDAKMIGADEPESHAEPEMDTDDAAGSMDMARMRDIVKSPEDEKAEETFDNEPEEKTQDVDSLVNVHSGGANRQKTQYRKEYPGDNPMAVEDKITEEELASSLRTQYESFKQAYQEAAKPDYIDLDKDGNKTEPMKKAAQDKKDADKK